MSRTVTYLALDFLVMFLLMMGIVVALKAVFPDLGVWILVVAGGLVGIVYPRIARHFGLAGEP